MLRINITEMEGWIARSGAIAARIDEAYTLAQALYLQVQDAYEGKALEESLSYAAGIIGHMEKLQMFHKIRTQHMQKTLEEMRRCDEELSRKISSLHFLASSFNTRSGSSRNRFSPGEPPGIPQGDRP